MPVRNVTVTDNQAKYIRDNYKRMSPKEMGEALKISRHVVYYNMKVMGLQTSKRGTRGAPPEVIKPGYFNVSSEKNWLVNDGGW